LTLSYRFDADEPQYIALEAPQAVCAEIPGVGKAGIPMVMTMWAVLPLRSLE
jgi:hypothetical protein